MQPSVKDRVAARSWPQVGMEELEDPRMKLSELIAGAGLSRAPGPQGDPEIAGICYDSRRVRPGGLFVALPGQKADGARFAADAKTRGAVAVVAERPLSLGGVVELISPEPRKALARLAANFHGRPAERLTLTGVTGTNGKTTTTFAVEALVRAAGRRPGIIGTVSYRFGGVSRPATHTTPESADLQALLREMADDACGLVCMEVSSHALAQDRAEGLAFQAVAFTNLTRDHLDYHRDMESYFEAKARLFTEHLAPAGVAVINADDSHGLPLAARLKAAGRSVWTFSARGAPGAALYASGVRMDLSGIRATFHTPAGELAVHSPLVGGHNLENLLGAVGLALGAGAELEPGTGRFLRSALYGSAAEARERVAAGIAALANVPGRLERVSGRGMTAFVDYAHTDDALARALAALRPLCAGKLWVVFGCGGDRDRGKRPLMGEAAARGADLVVVSSDNPRSEDPAAIIEEILPGLERAGSPRLCAAQLGSASRGHAVEPDRRAAIELALGAARPSDLVLIAGKGHEDYQIIGQTKQHFDDREEARRVLGVTSAQG